MAANQSFLNQSFLDENLEFFKMNVESIRVKSFIDWPFNGSAKCTPEKMAAAGFFHCPTDQEPDLVKCFICMKELDGWEPNDEPIEEHRSHAPKCPFVVGRWNDKEMKMKDMWKLEIARQATRVTKMMEEKIAEFERYAADARAEMEKLA